MKTAVTVTTTVQIGIETWRDIQQTKIFHDKSTIFHIKEWIKSIDNNSTISSVVFSDVHE
jgi:hypothetical protein